MNSGPNTGQNVSKKIPLFFNTQGIEKYTKNVEFFLPADLMCLHTTHICTGTRVDAKLEKILTLCKYHMYKQFLDTYCKNIQFCNPSAKFEEMFSV